MAADPGTLGLIKFISGVFGISVIGAFILIWRMYVKAIGEAWNMYNKAVDEVKEGYEQRLKAYKDMAELYDYDRIKKWMEHQKETWERETYDEREKFEKERRELLNEINELRTQLPVGQREKLSKVEQFVIKTPSGSILPAFPLPDQTAGSGDYASAVLSVLGFLKRREEEEKDRPRTNHDNQ